MTFFNPYSPSHSTADGKTRFWSCMIASTISTADADGADDAKGESASDNVFNGTTFDAQSSGLRVSVPSMHE